MPIALIVLVGLFLYIGSAEEKPVGDAKKASSAPEQLLPPQEPIEGWQRQGEPRTFLPENLWEYIDGQADMYITYGFVKLANATYAPKDNADKPVIVDIYDMGSKLNAFGVYSQMDSGDLKSAGVGVASYVLSPTLVFYKAPYFVSLNAGWIAEDTENALIQLAGLVDGKISDDGKAPPEVALLPVGKRLPGTLQYIPQSVLGHEFLPRGIEAQYNLDESKVKIFVVFYKGTQDAEKAFGKYRDYITDKGKTLIDLKLNGCKTISAEEPYQGNVLVVLCDKWLAGATHLKEAAQGRPLIEQVLANLKK